MIIKVTGYENFKSKKGEECSKVYGINDEKLRNGNGFGVETFFFFNKRVTPVLNARYEVFVETYTFNNEIRARVVDLKPV